MMRRERRLWKREDIEGVARAILIALGRDTDAPFSPTLSP
jgi:hypothetical protein